MDKLNNGQSIQDYIDNQIATIKKQVGSGKVILGLSGGVDSTVCAALIGKAIGKQLTCVFVDHGCMRLNEGLEIKKAFADWPINLVMVDAEKRFLDKLKGVSDPESKRKIIGGEFVRVFEEEAAKVKADYLAQGTIYPDIVESGGDKLKGEKGHIVKSHHNVGGLPDDIGFRGVIEPLRLLYKDEVRVIGRTLGVEAILVDRQPFPGPGLSIRVIGELSKERLDTLRLADYIFRQEIAESRLSKSINQFFAVLTPLKSVGAVDGVRTYGDVLALRAVTTTTFMEAGVAHIPYDVLLRVSERIIKEVAGVGRVVYDITPKPPGTIEWE